MGLQRRKREGQNLLDDVQENEDYFGGARRKRPRPRTSSSSADDSPIQSARRIVNSIHILLEQLLGVINSALSTLSSQQMNQMAEDVEECEQLKYRLRFLNQIPSTIYTNKQIIAENGEPLKIAICHATNSSHIITEVPLSSSQIQFFILEGEFVVDRPDGEILWTCTRILPPGEDKEALLIGKDLKLFLNNGVGCLSNLVVTDNSTWLKSKTFRLGANVTDKKILGKFPRIGEALSQPFRVMDGRSQANKNKKQHPPKWEDQLRRLDGIWKTGGIINLLSSKGINTVGDVLTIYQSQSFSCMRQLLHEIPDRIWKKMYYNALEYYNVPVAPSALDPSFVENEAMGAEECRGNLTVESTDPSFVENEAMGAEECRGNLESTDEDEEP